MISKTYKQFMADHEIKEGSKLQCTHTKMPSKTLNVFGKSYHIPTEDLKEFYKKYEEYVFVGKNEEFLTEKQTQDIFVVDFDFRYDETITSRQHTSDHLFDMIDLYMQLLEEYFIPITTDIIIFVMEKPNVNITSDKNGEKITKDGIHMFISLSVDRNIQMEIREKMISKLPNTSWKDLPIINKNGWNDVLDEGITKGSCNWTLYGSRKPGHEAYKVTHIYRWSEGKVWEFDNPNFDDGKSLSEIGLSVQTPHVNTENVFR